MNWYERRVRRGAAHLDAKCAESPGHRYANWRERIDVGALNMDVDRCCIIGQLTRSFYDARECYESKLWLLRHGFVVPGTELPNWLGGRGTGAFEARNTRLTQTWRDYITSERMKTREQVV